MAKRNVGGVVKSVKSAAKDLGVRIVVLHRGHVVVGRVEKEGSHWRITKAATIRRWGTKRGLGEIALDGPTNRTILDPEGTVRCHELVVIKMIDCNAEKWEAHINA